MYVYIIIIWTCVDPVGHKRSFRYTNSGSFSYINIVGLVTTGTKYITIFTDLHMSSPFMCILQRRLWDQLKIALRAFDAPSSCLIPCRLHAWLVLCVMLAEYNALLKYYLYIHNVIYMCLNNNKCCWCDITIYVVRVRCL